jgi:hypothetical protein
MVLVPQVVILVIQVNLETMVQMVIKVHQEILEILDLAQVAVVLAKQVNQETMV